MSPRPTCSAGPQNASRREIAGARGHESENCTVTVDDQMEALVLEEGELAVVLQDLLDTYGKTSASVANDLPGQIKQLRTLLDEFGWKGAYYEKVVNGKRYVILKGPAGLRSIFRGTRYLANHSQVMSYGIGRKAMRNAVKVNAVVSFIFVTGYNVIETVIRDDKDFIDAAAEVPVDLAKTIITGAAVAGAGAVAAAASAPVVVIVGAGIAVGIVVAIGLDYIDEKFEISASLKEWLRRELERAAQELERDMQEVRRDWQWCNSPGGIMPCLERMFGGF